MKKLIIKNENINAVESTNIDNNRVENTKPERKTKKSKEMEKTFSTITVNVNGVATEFIPTVTEYTSRNKELKSNSIEMNVEPTDYLEHTYHFCKADDFYKQDVKLFHSETGQLIPKGTDNVMVFMETPDTAKLFLQFEVYKHSIIDCKVHDLTVKDCYKAIASNDVMSKPSTAIDRLGWAVAVTENEYLRMLHRFCLEEDVNISTAGKYFNCRVSNKNIILQTITTKKCEYICRKVEDVKLIYNTIFEKVGYKYATQRQFIDSINKFEAIGYELKDILSAIKAFDLGDIKGVTVQGCLDRENCITSHILMKLQDLGFKATEKKIAA